MRNMRFHVMIYLRTRLIRYIISLFIVILIIQSIRYNFFPSDANYTYDADIHQYVPPDLRRYFLKSSSNYTVNDLLKLTNLSEELQLNSSKNSIHILTQWYSESDRRRQQELVAVLHMNVINNAVTNIHFIQSSKNCTIFDDIQIDQAFPIDLLKKKLIIYYYEGSERLTISQAFTYANQFIQEGYAIFLNLDVFFDRSLSILQHRPLLDRKTILYLSRYEVDPSITTLGLQCSDKFYVGSHDVLIFQPPLSTELSEKFPYEIGTWHIEVKMIYEFQKANFLIRNTCKSIRAWHLHSSQIRHQLMPSKKYIEDKNLYEVLKYPEYL